MFLFALSTPELGGYIHLVLQLYPRGWGRWISLATLYSPGEVTALAGKMSALRLFPSYQRFTCTVLDVNAQASSCSRRQHWVIGNISSAEWGVSLAGNPSPVHDPACLAVANRALANELGLLFSEGNARWFVSVFGGAEATFGLAMLNRDEPRS